MRGVPGNAGASLRWNTPDPSASRPPSPTRGRGKARTYSARQPAHHLVLRISAAEAVGEEGVEGDVFLAHETLRRQRAVGQHVKHGADAGGGGDLDGAAHQIAD